MLLYCIVPRQMFLCPFSAWLQLCVHLDIYGCTILLQDEGVSQCPSLLTVLMFYSAPANVLVYFLRLVMCPLSHGCTILLQDEGIIICSGLLLLLFLYSILPRQMLLFHLSSWLSVWARVVYSVLFQRTFWHRISTWCFVWCLCTLNCFGSGSNSLYPLLLHRLSICYQFHAL